MEVHPRELKFQKGKAEAKSFEISAMLMLMTSIQVQPLSDKLIRWSGTFDFFWHFLHRIYPGGPVHTSTSSYIIQIICCINPRLPVQNAWIHDDFSHNGQHLLKSSLYIRPTFLCYGPIILSSLWCHCYSSPITRSLYSCCFPVILKLVSKFY